MPELHPLVPPILFLDIDGVLNGHDYDREAESCTLLPACVDRFNRVLSLRSFHIVLSSAWRYMVLEGAMTLTGFAHMLQTHRVRAKSRLLDVTRRDSSPTEPRAIQIADWWNEHPEWRFGQPWVVLDDMDLGFTKAGMPFVQTDGNAGLSDENVQQLLAYLGGEVADAV